MNFQTLSKDIGLDEEECRELLTLFVETSLQEIHAVETALDAADASRAAEIAHSLKGAAVNLGLEECLDLAVEMEATARSNRLSETALLTAEFKKALETLAILACVDI